MAKKIILYSTQSCSYCVMLKNFLEEHKIEFEYIDVGENQAKAKEMVEKSGQMGVPVIEIDGEIIVGFDKARISELLGIKE
ncbi:MAG: glutaredoxin family protein [Nanoarchaeota archaeon]|nr:glutaredoxin family protein [Nanoarchaeota archaeon]